MHAKKGKSGSGEKRLYYCYYWYNGAWQLYQPKMDKPGAKTLQGLGPHIVGAKILKKPEAILVVSGPLEVPEVLSGVGFEPHPAALGVMGLTRHEV